MLQSEFENLIRKNIPNKEYHIIEKCYMYYDSIFPTKQTVAKMYNDYGLEFFKILNIAIDEQERKVKEVKLKNRKLLRNWITDVLLQPLCQRNHNCFRCDEISECHIAAIYKDRNKLRKSLFELSKKKLIIKI